MTARLPDSTSASPLEYHPSASKTRQHDKASATPTKQSGAHTPPAAQAVIHATVALPLTPHPRRLQQPSSVQSPYPRRAAV